MHAEQSAGHALGALHVSETFPLRYDGDGRFTCLHPKRIHLQPGEVHGWQMAEARSKASHDHFFACVNEAWMNLPEHLQEEFPTAEHLRKFALIKAGFCTQTIVVCATNGDAVKLAAKAGQLDRYSLVEIRQRTVTIWTADSQRRDAMGRKLFQEAKERALHVISDLVGTDVTKLKENAHGAA